MSTRLILWALAMAWVGFFVAGRGSYQPFSVTLTGAGMGLGAGLLLGIMFSRRQKRKHSFKGSLSRY